MSDSVWPHRRKPSRLPRPWDSPGKNTGVGCHFLFQCMKVKSEREVAQSCPTLRDLMDCSLPGSSVHGIFQARVLEWGAIAFSDWGMTHSFFCFQWVVCKFLKGRSSVFVLFLDSIASRLASSTELRLRKGLLDEWVTLGGAGNSPNENLGCLDQCTGGFNGRK